MSDLPEGVRGRVLAVLLLVVVLGALWAAIAVPLTDWFADRTDRIDRHTTLASRMAQIAADLPALRIRAASIQTVAPVAVLEGASDAVAGSALQQRLQQIGVGLGATLSSTEVLAGEPIGAYRRIGVRLAVNARWPVIVRLLEAIAANTPRLLVNDLQVQAMRSVVNDADPAMNVTMIVFGFRAGTAPPPAAAAAQ
jgi:general secretion pathway protein M